MLSLASNVLQFVQFTTDVIKSSAEIRKSSSGGTGDVLTLDTVYSRLGDLSAVLGSHPDHPAPDSFPSSTLKTVFAIRDLSQSCKEDCDNLLGIISKLKAEGGRWESFRVALRKALKQNDIAQLEERLGRHQISLTLHICTIARCVIFSPFSNCW